MAGPSVPSPLPSTESQLWPSLRTFWQPVAVAAAIADTPVGARLLDVPLVLVRLAGRIRCFRDLCIHRGTPLSLGWLDGPELVCAYHGWRYGADGRCTRIPALGEGHSIPRKARVDTFAAEERYGLVWVCLEDTGRAIPAFPEYGDPTYETYLGPPMERACSAARQVENFIDESHFAWVHEGILGDRAHAEAPHFDVERRDEELRFGWWERPNAIHPEGHHRTYRVQRPFTVHLRQVREGGVDCESLFFVVSPVSQAESRGFLFTARNYAVAPEEAARRRELAAVVGQQDKRIIESQRPDELPLDLSAELHLKGPDAAAVAYRRFMAELGVLVDAPPTGASVG
jgi:phenylpropionate dioxygenase-like ring-hydroxylating dioxygenase large terminal subunit